MDTVMATAMRGKILFRLKTVSDMAKAIND